MDSITVYLRDLIVTYGLKVAGAVAIVVIGFWLARRLGNGLRQALERSRLDASLTHFLSNLGYYALLVFVVLAALNQLGVETTSFVAVIGAAGLAVGLALEGALSNFAAGVLILLFRPFKVGDWVEAASIFGKVENILVFSTILVTRDNKTVIIPNAQVTGAPIVNYSQKGVMRVDMVFGIGYGDDLRKAKQVALDILIAHPLVAKEPAPTVNVLELADNSVNLAVRPYTTADHYTRVWFDVTEQVKLRFDAEGISIPFPQRDVHLYSQG